MPTLSLDAWSKLQPVDQVCFIPVDQIGKVRTYVKVEDIASQIMIDLTDHLMPSYNSDQSLCRQLHTFATLKYGDLVPAYDQALFSFLREPGSDNTVILMRTSTAPSHDQNIYRDVITTREPLDRFLENHTEIARECYLIYPKDVQIYLVIQDDIPKALDVTEPVTAAWHRDPSRSICYHLYEWFEMIHKDKVPAYEAMSNRYKFYTHDELGTMVVVLDGRI
jgi:hypothetical protein